MSFIAERVFLILFAWGCCLLLPLLCELGLSFTHLLVSLFCAYKLLILTQPENNAADRQISIIIVITNNKGCIRSVLLTPAW